MIYNINAIIYAHNQEEVTSVLQFSIRRKIILLQIEI